MNEQETETKVLSNRVVVTNLETGRESIYVGIGPEIAVLCAYAQERDDYETWTYREKYGDLRRQGNGFVYCGFWWARLSTP